MTTPHPRPFWLPDPAATKTSRIAEFGRWVARGKDAEATHDHTDYGALYRWSRTKRNDFVLALDGAPEKRNRPFEWRAVRPRRPHA
ncbi:hypothetical protein [Streptomyces afghaniensis]|uniref:hypothetical protein n=1 Tax=Streptomyces afghaniensis TaxID=66865 RepID=UPI003796D88E